MSTGDDPTTLDGPAKKGVHDLGTDTWLVTGGTGIFGANAARFLSSRASAVGLARDETGSVFGSSISCDVRDASAVRAALDYVRPSVVVHAAAMSRHEQCEENPDLAFEVNVEGTRIMASEAGRVGARFVYISTDAVFDGRKGAYREKDAPNPFSTYGQTKLLGEKAAMEAVDALVIRTNFFGWSPSGRQSILDFFVTALETGSRVPGYTNFTVTSMYVGDLVDVIWALVQRDARGLLHVASRDAQSKYEFGRLVAESFNLDPALIEPVSVPALGALNRGNRDISLSSEHAENVLGLVMPTQLDGLRRARDEMTRRAKRGVR